MNSDDHLKMGVAWYRPEQWALLRALAADPEKLEHTHGEWLVFATKALDDLRKEGITTVKIDVDVHELWRWCQSLERPLDGKARADYTAEQLRRGSAEQK